MKITSYPEDPCSTTKSRGMYSTLLPAAADAKTCAAVGEIFMALKFAQLALTLPRESGSFGVLKAIYVPYVTTRNHPLRTAI